MGVNDQGLPGLTAKQETTERAATWGPQVLQIGKGDSIIDSTVVDSRSSPTTDLQPGLLLGEKTSDGLFYLYDPDATDGTEVAAAIIKAPLRMLDANGNAADKATSVLIGGLWKASEIQGLDAQARAQLADKVIFDDDLPNGASFLGPPVRSKNVITDTTVVAADNGSLFVATTADCTFTLPTIANGMIFEFLRASDHEMVVASAEGDNMIVGNDLSADSITFTTAGQQIGAMVRVQAIYVGTTLKWLSTLPIPAFGTGLTGGFTYAIAT